MLVHGSGGNSGWPAQQPLAERYTLVLPTRSGYPPNPPLERIDFEDQAAELLEILEPGDHLVGHSYGGVVSLLAAPSAELASLTVLEPPAFGVALGQPPVRFVQTVGALGPYDAPSPLPPRMEASVRAMMVERPPWEARIPLAELSTAPYPKLVVSGAHDAAFDAVCDELERRVGAERAVLPGAGHSIPRAPGFNERLETFLDRVSQHASGCSATRSACGAVLDEERAQALFAVVVGGHQRREVVLLARVRVGAVLEQELRELVADVCVPGRCRAVQRHDLEVVARRRVDLRPTLDEQARRVDVAEEARQPERLEAVVGPSVRPRRILVEQLSQTLGATDGGGLEDVELGIGGEQLVRMSLIPSVDRLQQL